MGIYPKPFLSKIEASVENLVSRLNQRSKIFVKAKNANSNPVFNNSETKAKDRKKDKNHK
jgi:hypothetical protein